MEAKIHCGSWQMGDDEAYSNLVRTAKFYMAAQLDMGHLLSLSATNAACATVRLAQTIAKDVLPRIVTGKFDSSFEPFWKKKGMIVGLAASEYGAGSDISGIKMCATKDAHDGWRLNGIKSFISAPQADALVVLAQDEKGLSCFFVPRFTPNEALNGLRYIRKKSLSGLKSAGIVDMAFENAQGWLIGTQGQGVEALKPLSTFVRQDVCAGLAGLMRAGLMYAVHYLFQRQIEGEPLLKQPLIANMLADVCLDVVAATILVHRVALGFDRAPYDKAEAHLVKLLAPATRFMLSQIAPRALDQLQSLLGSHGLSEERPMARFVDDARALALWEIPHHMAIKEFAQLVHASQEARMASFADVIGLLNKDNPHNQHLEAGFDNLVSSMQSAHKNGNHIVRIMQFLSVMAATSLLRSVVSTSLADAYESSRLSARYQLGYGGLDTPFKPESILQICVPWHKD